MGACCTLSYALLECENDERQRRHMMSTLTRAIRMLLLLLLLLPLLLQVVAANLIAMMYLPHANLCQFAEVLRRSLAALRHLSGAVWQL